MQYGKIALLLGVDVRAVLDQPSNQFKRIAFDGAVQRCISIKPFLSMKVSAVIRQVLNQFQVALLGGVKQDRIFVKSRAMFNQPSNDFMSVFICCEV